MPKDTHLGIRYDLLSYHEVSKKLANCFDDSGLFFKSPLTIFNMIKLPNKLFFQLYND